MPACRSPSTRACWRKPTAGCWYSAPTRRTRRRAARGAPGLVCLGLDASLPGAIDTAADARARPATDPQVAVHEDDVILTLFTSGTTGVLKAARHTQRSYAAICRNVLLNLLPATPDDVMLHAASLIHASGVFVLPFWLRGGKTVVLPGFEPVAFRRRWSASASPPSTRCRPCCRCCWMRRPSRPPGRCAALRHLWRFADAARGDRARHGSLGPAPLLAVLRPDRGAAVLAVLRPEDHRGERLGACGRRAGGGAAHGRRGRPSGAAGRAGRDRRARPRAWPATTTRPS